MIKQTEVCVWGVNEDRTIGVKIERFVEGEKYHETYVFENLSNSDSVLLNDTVGIVFPYNDLFDKKENIGTCTGLVKSSLMATPIRNGSAYLRRRCITSAILQWVQTIAVLSKIICLETVVRIFRMVLLRADIYIREKLRCLLLIPILRTKIDQWENGMEKDLMRLLTIRIGRFIMR